ncbi:unnamed protein product [Dibothriocephalus latus]|uniref:Uncharacterized protein n=1 Tax=Dibothriocephalus latus TaxID=60516 RepID=A0A3P6TQR3_DIBLA|nr:unnamed protein product [Dibothriocephalus latus]
MITSCMKERLPEIEAWRKRKQTAESIEGEAEKEEEEEGGDDDNSRRNGHLRLGNGLSAAEELVSLKLALTRLQAASLMGKSDVFERSKLCTLCLRMV